MKPVQFFTDEELLDAFRQRAELAGVPYQSQIKRLMREWVLDGRQETAESR